MPLLKYPLISKAEADQRAFNRLAKKHREEGPEIPIEEQILRMDKTFYLDNGRPLQGLKFDRDTFFRLANILPPHCHKDPSTVVVQGHWGPIEVSF